MANEIRNGIIVAVVSSVATAGILWSISETGGWIKRVVIPDLPGGAVIAFDGKCPENEGWFPYKKAEGRFLIGVGQGPLEKPIHLEQDGGEEKHKLTPDEMPEHSHSAFFGMSDDLGDSTQYTPTARGTDVPRFRTGNKKRDRFTINDVTTIRSTGVGKPHNNMPPYIALYFCKKKEG